MTKSLKDTLLEAIRSAAIIPEEKLEEALALHKKDGGSLPKLLIQQGFISSKNLVFILSRQFNIPPIDLSKYKIAPEIIKMIPEKVSKQYKIMPISRLGNTLTVAISDPTNIVAVDEIKALTGLAVDLLLAAETDIDTAIATYYKHEVESDIADILSGSDQVDDMEVVEDDEKIDISEINVESKKAPVVKLVGMILNEALASRASDIHIEPQERSLRVRYRIDGHLQEALSIPKANQNAIIARLKIMSKMDITENRVPQDGRFKIKFRDREVDFRVSALPLIYGNKIVMRALDRSSLSIGLDRLGFLPETIADFKTAISRPYGMLLITGPTGSGKSTTLYSILNSMNTVGRNIVTIEDPVEYQLEGITQIPVHPEIGLSFASGLKSVLRQSPDIIMVGEIRDSETADIAIKASLTGQFVLSTLHTNDAPSAVTRLVDMGVEPYLIASSIIMTAAQRLARKICPHCKEEYKIPESVLARVGGDFVKNARDKTFFRGKGCAKCKNSGYLGRIGVLETFFIDDHIRGMIVKKESSDKIKEYAVSKGMKTLRDNGLTMFLNGVTTLEEILRITSEE